MSTRGTCWSVTINNPVACDEEAVATARQRSGWKVEGQLEKGENGTPHYQLMVKTPQVRFSALKKQFPRAHIELARNQTALEQYVMKEDTRIGVLPSSEMYPSPSKAFDMFADWCNTDTKGTYLNMSPEDLLLHFDHFIRVKIEEGYYLESIGVNPQTRSAIKLYGQSIIERGIRRQTDRQTDNEKESVALSVNEDEGFETASESSSSETQTTCSSSFS